MFPAGLSEVRSVSECLPEGMGSSFGEETKLIFQFLTMQTMQNINVVVDFCLPNNIKNRKLKQIIGYIS